MNTYSIEFLNKFFGFSGTTEGINMRFKDITLEDNYQMSNIKDQQKKSCIFCVFIGLAYLFVIVYSILINKTVVRNTYIYLCGLILEIVLAKFTSNSQNNYRRFQLLKLIRFFLFFSASLYTFFYPITLPDPVTNLKLMYGCVTYLNFLYLYILEFSYIIMITVPLFNSLLLFLAKDLGYLGELKIIGDIIIILMYYFASYLIKRDDHSNRKAVFFESYKNSNYIEYVKNLIDVLNNMVISLKGDEVLFVNNYTLNYLEKTRYSYLDTINYPENKEINTKENFIKENENDQNLFSQVSSFFKSLKLTSSFNKKFSVGKDLLEIIIDLFSQEDEASKNFSRIGYFTSNNEGQYQYFDVYIRKLKFKDDIIEILIYDNTEIKQAEKTNIESKYKQKILGKIAHEFKTPLITIMSLISRIMNSNVDTNLVTKTHLNHINNLSNYVLSLISDIIQYVSNCTDIRINKCEIYLKEVLEFSFNVLKTLVECNENKNTQIKTELQIDQSLEDVRINTDEHRLKQILLNFISNAVKFTLSGSIILKAKLKNECIEISVKDTGLGIKDDDKHLIFQENIQLDVNHEYNTRGSGLGLSITKNLANFLHISIGFNSIYSKGSKFFIIFNDFMKEDLLLKQNLVDSREMSNKFDILIMDETILESEKPIRLKEEEITTQRVEYKLSRYCPSYRSIKVNYDLEVEECNSFSLGTKTEYKDLIVVIDDHQLVRENTINLIQTVLKNMGKSNVGIIEGSDGIDLLYLISKDKEKKIKYIISDENMEYLNGSEAIKIIRSLEYNKKIPKYHIISITAFDDDQSKQRILNAGVDKIITKPCTKSILSDTLTKLHL